jgi:hypothetical protein
MSSSTQVGLTKPKDAATEEWCDFGSTEVKKSLVPSTYPYPGYKCKKTVLTAQIGTAFINVCNLVPRDANFKADFFHCQ